MPKHITADMAVLLGMAPPVPVPTVKAGDIVILNPDDRPERRTEVMEANGELLVQIPFGRGKNVVILFDPEDWPKLRLVRRANPSPPPDA